MINYILTAAAAVFCIYSTACAYYPTTIHNAYIEMQAMHPRQVIGRGQPINVFHNPAAITAKPKRAKMHLAGSLNHENWIPLREDEYNRGAYATGAFAMFDSNLTLALGGYYSQMNFGTMDRTLADGTEWYQFESKEHFYNIVAGVSFKNRYHAGITGSIIYSDLFPGDAITLAARDTTFSVNLGAQAEFPLIRSTRSYVDAIFGAAISNLGPSLKYVSESVRPLGTSLCAGAGINAGYMEYLDVSAGAGWGFSAIEMEFASECIEAGGDITIFTILNGGFNYRMYPEPGKDSDLVPGWGYTLDLARLRGLLDQENGNVQRPVSNRPQFNIIFKYYKELYDEHDHRENQSRMKLDFTLTDFRN